MQSTAKAFTAEQVITSLGYSDTMDAARQQARMILLGRLSRYEAAIRRLEAQWGSSLGEMKMKYEVRGKENAETDDSYLDWQWYSDAIETVNAQLATINNG